MGLLNPKPRSFEFTRCNLQSCIQKARSEGTFTQLKVSWNAADYYGGNTAAGYKVEWNSSLNDFEVQKRQPSLSRGITELLAIKFIADTIDITGFFTLTFDGETTEHIANNAKADGEELVESKLDLLSTVGDVDIDSATTIMLMKDFLNPK